MTKFGFFEPMEFKLVMRKIEHEIKQRREIKKISKSKTQGMI